MSGYDTSKYDISILPSSSDGSLRFYMGEPIRVKWRAPQNHSRKDWIGIYRVCGFDPHVAPVLMRNSTGWRKHFHEGHEGLVARDVGSRA